MFLNSSCPELNQLKGLVPRRHFYILHDRRHRDTTSLCCMHRTARCEPWIDWRRPCSLLAVFFYWVLWDAVIYPKSFTEKQRAPRKKCTQTRKIVGLFALLEHQIRRRRAWRSAGYLQSGESTGTGGVRCERIIMAGLIIAPPGSWCQVNRCCIRILALNLPRFTSLRSSCEYLGALSLFGTRLCSIACCMAFWRGKMATAYQARGVIS